MLNNQMGRTEQQVLRALDPLSSPGVGLSSGFWMRVQSMGDTGAGIHLSQSILAQGGGD